MQSFQVPCPAVGLSTASSVRSKIRACIELIGMADVDVPRTTTNVVPLRPHAEEEAPKMAQLILIGLPALIQ
jgi:hypothetical protein